MLVNYFFISGFDTGWIAEAMSYQLNFGRNLVMLDLIRRFKYRLLRRQVHELTPFQTALVKHINQATNKRH